MVLALFAVLIPIGLVLSSIDHSSGSKATGATGVGPTSPRAFHRLRVSATTSPSAVAPLRGLAVSVSQVTLTDTTRTVVSHGAVLAPVRTLPIYLWTPSGSGPFPLVVFVHGYGNGPLTYQRFCATLAASGYVVAAPSFPLEDPQRGFGLDRGDLPDEAADVSFVIGALERGPTGRTIDGHRIAVVGHSDGADVALMIGYGLTTADARIGAVVADAPDPVSTPVVSSSTPLLLVQGTADSVVPYTASQAVFGQVQAPTYYLSLVAADHLPPIEGGTPWTPTLDSAVAEFLDATIGGREPEGSLAGELGSLPLTRLQMTRLG